MACFDYLQTNSQFLIYFTKVANLSLLSSKLTLCYVLVYCVNPRTGFQITCVSCNKFKKQHIVERADAPPICM